MPIGVTTLSVLVTGSAGFIGGHVARRLEARGDTVVPVDPRDPTAESFAGAVAAADVDAVVHLGAITSTLETDEALLRRVNVELSQEIWRWCTAHAVPLVYASSASVYGSGAGGFAEDAPKEPLNGYARSKLAFDEWALAQHTGPPRWAGCRFFNVYGPGEAHKGRMASVVSKAFEDVELDRPTRLFKWGEHRRDFVWVGDVVDVVLWLLESGPSDVYNVGSGVTATFEELATFVWASRGLPPRIEWIDMADDLKARYQDHTLADLGRLRAAGWDAPMATLEAGVACHAAALAEV